jgi:hypothetical protein
MTRSRSFTRTFCGTRAGLRVGIAITEGTANFLVNRPMNKSQQMRWTRGGADILLQARCVVDKGTLGYGFGQRLEPVGIRRSAPRNGHGILTPDFRQSVVMYRTALWDE